MIFTVESKSYLNFEYVGIESWGRSNDFCYRQYTPCLYEFLLCLKGISPDNLTEEDQRSLRKYFYTLLVNFSEKFDQLVSFPIMYLYSQGQFTRLLNKIDAKEFKDKIFSINNRKKIIKEMELLRNSIRFFLFSFQQKFGYPFKGKKLSKLSSPQKTTTLPYSLVLSYSPFNFNRKSNGLNNKNQICNQFTSPQQISKIDSLVEQNLELIDEYIKIIEKVTFNDKTPLHEVEKEIESLLTKGKEDLEEMTNNEELNDINIYFSTKLEEVMKLDKCIREELLSIKFSDEKEKDKIMMCYLLGKILIIIRTYIHNFLGTHYFFPYNILSKEELAETYAIRCNCSHWKNKIRRSIPNRKAIIRKLEDSKENRFIKLPWYIWPLLEKCIPCSYRKPLWIFEFNSYNRHWLNTIIGMD